MAKICLETLTQICKAGARRHIPSEMELFGILKQTQVTITVKLLDGNSKSVDVGSFTTVKELSVRRL
jgi:hypothetical protein